MRPVLTRRQVLRLSGALGAAGLLFPVLNACSTSPSSGAKASGGGKIALRFWTFLDPKSSDARAQAQSKAISLFEERHPNVKINVQVMAWQQIDPQLIQATQAGAGPDVTRLAGQSVGYQADAKTIVPLNEMIGTWSPAVHDDFFGKWSDYAYAGKNYSILFEPAIDMLFYRKDLLQKATLDVPTTWDEFAQVAAKIGDPPKLWGTSLGTSRNLEASNLWETLPSQIWGNGGQLLDGQKAAFDSPAWVATYEYWAKLVNQLKVAPPDMVAQTTDTLVSGYTAGTYGMIFEPNLKWPTLAKGSVPPKGSLGMTPLPSVKSGEASQSVIFGWHLAIGANSKNRDAAWQFIDFMVSAEVQLIQAQTGGQVPSRVSVQANPWFKTPEATFAAIAGDVLAKHGRAFAFPAGFPKMADAMGVAMQNVVSRGADAASELKNATQTYNVTL